MYEMNAFRSRVMLLLMNLLKKVVIGSLADMGEGPHWDNDTQNLYYVDLNAGKILRYSYTENKVYAAKVENEQFASFIIPIEDESELFVVGSGRRVLVVKWNGVSKEAVAVETLFEVQMDDQRYEGNRFNDAKCDSKGRLFAGTMHYKVNPFEERRGELYKYDTSVELVKSDVCISNGLEWNYEMQKFYFADTCDFDVKEYDYNVQTGKVDVDKPNVVLDLHEANYKHIQPDGVTIDTDGNIYVATFNGSAVYVTEPRTRTVLSKISIPCKHVTSVAFGGPNFDILFVTTSNQDSLRYPCGQVFQIIGLGAKGYPMNKFKYVVQTKV